MPRVLLLVGTGGFAAGLILGEYISQFWPFVLALVTTLWFLWTRQGRRLVVVAWTISFGIFVMQQQVNANVEATRQLMTIDQPLTGVVTRVSEQSGRQNFEVINLGGLGGGRASTKNILPMRPGDYLRIQCRWTAVVLDQQRRAWSQGVLVECRNPVSIQVQGPGHDWRAWLARARGQVVSLIQKQYHHPQSDLLAGILLGVQESMSADLRQSFRATGTSHIVALSGFNVTIIITILARTLNAFVGRRLAVWPTILLIIAFVIMTGASASVVRAAVMSVIVVLCQHLGRPVAMSRMLAYTFVLMTAVNPFILRYDLGFQLSFFATIGLVYVSPALATRLTWVPESAELRGNLSSTLAAMVATEPLLLWTFGRFSIVAPAVNIMVLPFIPLIMAAGAVALIFPWAIPVTDALLQLVLWFITTAGSWTFAQVITPWWVAGGVAGVAALIMIRLAHETNDETSRTR